MNVTNKPPLHSHQVRGAKYKEGSEEDNYRADSSNSPPCRRERPASCSLCKPSRGLARARRGLCLGLQEALSLDPLGTKQRPRNYSPDILCRIVYKLDLQIPG